MALLLALCGPKHDISVKEVELDGPTQSSVQEMLEEQEVKFRRGIEVPFDQNWKNDHGDIMTTEVPEGVRIFDDLNSVTDTSVEPVSETEIEGILGFAMKLVNAGAERILVQAFTKQQQLTRPGRLALILGLHERGTFTRLEESAFHLDERILCIVEDGKIKFRSLHKLGRIIDTSGIFSAATNAEVRSFARKYSSLFDISDIDAFVSKASRNTRKYMASVEASRALQGHNPRTLLRATIGTKLRIQTNSSGKIEMPQWSGEITEFFRFLNDGRYVGPVSRKPYITNSRRLVT